MQLNAQEVGPGQGQPNMNEDDQALIRKGTWQENQRDELKMFRAQGPGQIVIEEIE